MESSEPGKVNIMHNSSRHIQGKTHGNTTFTRQIYALENRWSLDVFVKVFILDTYNEKR